MNAGGICYLVGAGPGDPMLITRRGLRCLREADIVFHDRLANAELLRETKTGSEHISVGKTPGNPGIGQEEICRLLIESTRSGKTVVRLKGGDPFLFGRGGEEAVALAQAGLRFEIVPGITAGIAASACAGIPLTHRGIAGAVTFVTGHESEDADTPNVDWRALGALGHSLCIYMGMANLDIIRHELIAGGRSPGTPAAVIQNASLPAQSCVVATLETLSEGVSETGMRAPAIILVGEIAKLRESCSWFEKRPLFGKRVLLLRTENQSRDIAEALEEAGAAVMTCPAIRIEPVPFEIPENATFDSQRKPCAEIQPAGYDPLSRALICLAREAKPGWIVFTSANGVEQTWLRLRQLGLDARAFASPRLAAIGPKTAEALTRYGLVPDFIAEKPSSADLLEAFRSMNTAKTPIKHVVLFRSSLADTILPDGLRENGYTVDDIVAYRAYFPEKPDSRLQEWLEHGRLDAILFFSGSTVEGFRVMAGDALDSALFPPRTLRFVAIGLSAQQALMQADLPCDITVPIPHFPDILRGLRDALRVTE